MPHVFESPRAAGEAFATWIRRTAYADATQAMYLARVTAYLEWLTAAGEDYAEALTDPHVRDYAVRDYRKGLLTAQKAAVSTVEGSLSAIGTFYEYLGVGRPL